MEARTVILWIHALSGAAWVAACGCFVIAGLAIVAGGEEQANFALIAAPKIDAFNLIAAAILLVTGGINLALAGITRNFRFSGQFGLILGAKVILFIAMALAMGRAMRITASLRASGAASKPPAPEIARSTKRTLWVHGAIAVMGGIALLLGLWLMGS